MVAIRALRVTWDRLSGVGFMPPKPWEWYMAEGGNSGHCCPQQPQEHFSASTNSQHMCSLMHQRQQKDPRIHSIKERDH